MKLALINDDGTVSTVFEDVLEYDLSKPFAIADFMDDIRRAIKENCPNNGTRGLESNSLTRHEKQKLSM